MLSARGPSASLEAESTPHFETQLRTVLGDLRTALRELLVESGADPSRPQHVARHLGLDKTLAWKVARLATATDPVASLPMVPGESGMEILLRAAAKVSTPEAAITRVREALRAFDQLVATHADDRATLELMATELLPAADRAERDEAARRLAFQGNSAIWGLRARARFATYFAAPTSGKPGRLDLAFIGGLLGFRRLREASRTTIFQEELYRDDGSPLHVASEPFFPLTNGAANGAQGIPLLPEFCRPNLPPLRKIATRLGAIYEVPEGPVGRAHSADYVYGQIERNVASAYRDEVDRYGDHPTRLFAPVETAQIDLLIDQSLGFRMPPEASLHSMLSADNTAPHEWTRDQLPLYDAPQFLGSGQQCLASPIMPRPRVRPKRRCSLPRRGVIASAAAPPSSPPPAPRR